MQRSDCEGAGQPLDLFEDDSMHVEGELGHYLEQLERISWEESSKSVVTVLSDLMVKVEELTPKSDTPIDDCHEELHQSIQSEISEIKVLTKQYMKQHPSISDDQEFCRQLMEQLGPLD